MFRTTKIVKKRGKKWEEVEDVIISFIMFVLNSCFP